MKINYLDLLIKLSNGETPDLIKLELNCGERYYQAFYDDGEFNYYGLCDAHLEDEDFKYYLSDTLLESQMFEDNIEIIEEDKEIVIDIDKWGIGALEEIGATKDYKIRDLQKYIELLMYTQNEIIDKLKEIVKLRGE